jgi:ribose transport system ATP-binding protein
MTMASGHPTEAKHGGVDLQGRSIAGNAVPLVRLRGIGKSFGPATVLMAVDLDFTAGEVHALVGENGAGKSTIGKIVGGYYAADSGTVEIDGEAVLRWTPRAALGKGIAMIHQELQLVPQLSVAQNVFLGIEENVLGATIGSERARFRELDRRCGFRLDPDAIVGGLRIAERQKVEIMRAIARNARLIIMDEPASSLTADEVERLHKVISWLRDDGRSVVYITHQLDHVFSLCDRVTIMRDGRLVRTSRVMAETRSSLVEAMIGGPSDIMIPARPPRPDTAVLPVLETRGISTGTGLSDVSISVRPGEIVGLIGLVGSGRSELARAIFGADAITAGEVWIGNKHYRNPSPHESIRRGVAFVPEDRRKQGLDLTQTVRPNMSLVHPGLASRYGILRRDAEYRLVRRLIDWFGIAPNDPDGNVVVYSGGNQQKVLLSRWTARQPLLAILDEPSRGVDIGARRRIHDFIVDLASKGVAVLLISSELEEVLALSHRGYLLSDGGVIDEVDCAKTSEADLLRRLFDVDPGRRDENFSGAAGQGGAARKT